MVVALSLFGGLQVKAADNSLLAWFLPLSAALLFAALSPQRRSSKMPTGNKNTPAPKPTGKAPPSPPQRPAPRAAVAPPPPPPEPEPEEEIPQDEEQQQEEPSEFGDISEEEAGECCDKLCAHFQMRYAGMRAGPRPEVGDVEGWVDELVLPILLQVLQWWRNRQKSATEGGDIPQ